MPSQQADAAACCSRPADAARHTERARPCTSATSLPSQRPHAKRGRRDIATAGILAERERALAAQTEQLQLVSQHQFEMRHSWPPCRRRCRSSRPAGPAGRGRRAAAAAPVPARRPGPAARGAPDGSQPAAALRAAPCTSSEGSRCRLCSLMLLNPRCLWVGKGGGGRPGGKQSREAGAIMQTLSIRPRKSGASHGGAGCGGAGEEGRSLARSRAAAAVAAASKACQGNPS